MISNPPRNHTSIYLSPHIKSNWEDFQKFVTAKGFVSFNSYTNNVIIEDFRNNWEKVMKTKQVKIELKLDMYDMSPQTIKDRLNSYTNGEILDLVILVSDFRNLIIREADKRDIKI